MKSSLFAATIAAGALYASALAAAAQTPAPAAPVVAQHAAPEAAVGRDESRAPSAAAKTRADDRYCLRQTGSRIHSQAKQGCTAYGRRYDREDMQRTGEVDVASALRKLDPAVR